MSFCGSIVSNDFPQFSGTADSYIEDFKDGMRNEIAAHYAKTPT